MNGDRPYQNDAIISLESTAEWQVHDILYDGQERYVAPLTFTDYVAKYARRVDWRKLLGTVAIADDYNADDEVDEATSGGDKAQPQQPYSGDKASQRLPSCSSEKVADEAVEAAKQTSKYSPTPGDETDEWKGNWQDHETERGEGSQRGVGPWDSVAKRLLQSLTEMNVLLDAIQVARSGKYLMLDSVQQDALEHPKNAILAAKKKAVTSASVVLFSLADHLRPKGAVPASTSLVQQQLDLELEELMEMRKNWRLKKVGNAIVGDLSYFSGGGSRPNATFEAKKVDRMQRALSGPGGSPGAGTTAPSTRRQTWEVLLPKDLEESLRLTVSIQAPGGSVVEGCSYFGKNLTSVAAETNWRRRLQLAQRTLFCKDLFAQLLREAAHIPELCCASRGRSIVVRLPSGYALRISLDSNSSDSEAVASMGGSVFALEHNLQKLFDAELDGVSEVIIPRPVAAPLTHLSKKTRLAGPDAISLNALSSHDSSEKLLMQRIIDQTSHLLLYRRCKETIDEFVSTCRDPVVSIHWCPETTAVWTVLRMQMMTPNYEFCGKTTMVLEIRIDDIKATLRDGEVVTFSSNVQELSHFLKLRARQHIVSAVGTLCRPYQWQTLYSNPCHLDENGDTAPAILVGHPAGTSGVFVTYPLAGDPIVRVQCSLDGERRLPSDLLGNDNQSTSERLLWSHLRNTLRSVDYDQLPGANFLHKIELLIATVMR